MHGTFWTAERDATITQMAGDNLSFTKIAAALGISRKAITNRAEHLGLSRGNVVSETRALIWDEARAAELKRLWGAGMPCSRISAILGVSRNAVIGKAHRLQLEPRARPPKRDRPSGAGRGKYCRRLHTPHTRDVFGKLIAPEAFIPRADDVEPLPGITIDNLTANSCRYPRGDAPILFCGHPQQPGSSYCPSHHALCWRPRVQIDREQSHQTRRENFRAFKAELVGA